MGKKLEKSEFGKTIYKFLLSSAILLMLSGCGRIKKDTSVKDEDPGNGITVSNDTIKSDGRIFLSTAGYELEGSKLAMITGTGEEETFNVIDTDTGEGVFTGKVKYKNETGICDFSELVREGSYYILTDSGIESGEFGISRDIYRQLLAGRISRFGEDEEREERINAGNFPECCLRIADRLLMGEFFPTAVDGEAASDSMVIPRTVLLAKSEVEELKDLTDKDGRIKASVSFDLGSTYGYSAVMALFSYEYERFEKKYARECADIAASVYKNAENEYEEASVKEKRDADDKRYWASAQLYKLTGRNEYKLAAESYCEDPPKGFNKDKSGYLGTIAYLTCYNRIDLNDGELLITSIMDDINDAVRESFKEDFLAVASDEPDDREIGAIYEKARLMVLGNYISKNIRYVEGGENQVAYLYGRNALGKDYAFDQESDYYYEPMEFILAGLIDSYLYEDKKPEAMKKQ